MQILSNRGKRVWSLVCALVLVFSLSSTLTARADELSDAQSNLANSQAKLTSLQTALNNANGEINALTSKIAATDSTTAEGQSAISNFTTLLDAAKAAKAVIEPQIAPLQSDISALTVKIAALIAAQNAGKNCPADWGLSGNSFTDGIESGVFTYNSKVGTELFKDQKNIVVSSNISLSKDGQNWKPYRQFSSIEWVNYSVGLANNYPINSYQMRPVFMSSPYEILRNSNSQVKVLTTLQKQGCVDLVIESDAKPLAVTQVSFAKSSIDELYSAYPQAFQNYLERDKAKTVVANIQTAFPEAATAGNQFNVNTVLSKVGGFNSFAIVTYPRSSGCVGDINYVTVNPGAACELGIYWIWNSTIKYVDSVSTVGGMSEALKQQAAMKVQLTTIQTATLKLLSNLDGFAQQWQALNQKYADPSKAGQGAVDEYMALYRSVTDGINSASTMRDQSYQIVNSQYANSELVTLVKNFDSTFSKYLSVASSLISNIKGSAGKVGQYANTVSAAVSDETDRLGSLKRTLAQVGATAANIDGELTSLQNSGEIAKNPTAFANKWMNILVNLINDANNYASGLQNSLNRAQAIMKANPGTADSEAWASLMPVYSSLLAQTSTIRALATKWVTYFNNQSAPNSDLQSELKYSSDWAITGNQIADDLAKQWSTYPALVKAKGILSDGAARNNEAQIWQSLIDKYSSQLNSLYKSQAYAKQMASNGDSNSSAWAKVVSLYASAATGFSKAIKTLTSMLNFIQKGDLSNISSSSSVSDSNSPNFVDLQGDEEVAAGSVTYKKDKQGRYLITVTSNQEDTDFVVKAIKPKSKAIIFNATSDADGNIFIRTSRKLAGYVLQLVLDGEVLSKTATLK